MAQLTVEQRTFLVKNFFETGSFEVRVKGFRNVSPSGDRPRLKRFGRMLESILPTAQP